MFEPLPERLDLLRDAARGRAFEGRIPLDRMTRLRDAAVEAVGEAGVELSLGRDEQGQCYMRGRAKASVSMTCQRCLKPVVLELDASFSLGLIQGEQEAGRLAESYEPLMVGRDPMDVAPLIEDELLLALPVVPRHETCAVDYAPGPMEESESAPERENPFAALADIKRGAANGGDSEQ